MAEQKAAARAAWKGSGDKASEEIWYDIADTVGSTEFTGYSSTRGEGQIVALVKDGARVESATVGETVTILTNQTPFYGESGGQMGDIGTISALDGFAAIVSDTSKPLGRLHGHKAIVKAGTIKLGDTVQLAVDVGHRDRVRANHSATHLLHAALRGRLGSHVTQKGSLVAPDRLRFDFSHPEALSPVQIALIEADVNAQIRHNDEVTTRLMTPDDAVAAGAMALFGEKYGDEVRVLAMGQADDNSYSVELCGGTHVRATGDIALFKIISESAVSSGIRRIEALTGEAARLWLIDREDRLRQAAATLRTSPDDVPARISALVEQSRRLERELADAKKALALGGGAAASAAMPEQIGSFSFLGQVIPGLDPKELRGLLDQNKKILGSGVTAIVAIMDDRASIAVGVTDDLIGTLSAVDLVRAGVEALGGKGGGGRPDMAQGGGPAAANAVAAIEAVKATLVKVPA
jgi:alanyl-tRNA synthetase